MLTGNYYCVIDFQKTISIVNDMIPPRNSLFDCFAATGVSNMTITKTNAKSASELYTLIKGRYTFGYVRLYEAVVDNDFLRYLEYLPGYYYRRI